MSVPPLESSSNSDSANQTIVLRSIQNPATNSDHGVTLPPIKEIFAYALQLPKQQPQSFRVILPAPFKLPIPSSTSTHSTTSSESIIRHESPQAIQVPENPVLTRTHLKTHNILRMRQRNHPTNSAGLPYISYEYTVECQWDKCTEKSAKVINLEELIEHLCHYHGLERRKNSRVKATCGWTGCSMSMREGSLVRHTMNAHFMRKVSAVENAKLREDQLSD